MSEAGEKPKADPASSGSRFALQIGSVLGIPIRVHATFLLILVWFGMAAAASSRNVPREIAFVLALFACVLLHELGHAAWQMDRTGGRSVNPSDPHGDGSSLKFENDVRRLRGGATRRIH